MSGPLCETKNEDGSFYGWMFECPGCQRCHAFDARWTFNGDRERPTFTPSLLVRGVASITDDEHARIMAGEKIEPRPYVCHSYVTNGQIQFLSDSTHALAGQTVPLEPWEDGKAGR